MAAIAYLLYSAIFVPYQAKTAAYAKLKAKERAELDRKLDAEHYFGAKVESDESIDIPIKVRGLFGRKKKVEPEL